MITTRELCHALSATLHILDVDRWAKHLETRELLSGLDHDVCDFDAALLLAAVGPLQRVPGSKVGTYPTAILTPGKPQKTWAFWGHSVTSRST